MQLNVIPYPAVVEYIGPDLYRFAGSACIRVNRPVLLRNADYLHDALQQRFNVTVQVDKSDNKHDVAGSPSAAITLHLSEQLEQLQSFRWSQEAYELTCDSHGVQIAATSVSGIFYGVQTLLQALQVSASGLVLPYTRVLDAPRFIWRGVLLDVGRHFFSVPFIKKLLDVMALYKMNRFHWHLTEDQGWRLDVPALPRLAEVAAWRGTPPVTPSSSTDQQQHSQQQSDMSDSEGPTAAAGDTSRSMLGRSPPSAAVYHGGCYSMADVAAVVEYAAERCIEVVPEIELPGHCCAALAAYPHLSCTNDVTAVSTQWGIHEDIYCAGNDEVFQFLEVVFDQVVSQFPCEYVHIGGDEVPKARWKECDKCQERIKQEGLSDECELQSWFVRRVSNMLAERGRRLIGWDEILEGGLAEGATVMSWRGTLGGVLAAKSGHDVIMTPTSHCYFDYKQAPSADEPGAWYACLPLHVVYHFDPVPQQLQHKATPEQATAEEDKQMQKGCSGQLDSSNAGAMQTVSGRFRLSGRDAAAAAAAAHVGEGPAAAAEDAEMTTADEDNDHHDHELTDHQGASHQLSDRRPFVQQQQQHTLRQHRPVAAAAVIASSPAAATAAGPHFPGEPPGVALTHLAATAAAGAPAAAAAAAEAAEGSSGDDKHPGGVVSTRQSSADVDDGGSGSSSSGLILSGSECLRVLGSQANLWCEYVQDEETAEYMLLPRLAAMAEAVWTPADMKDWGDFLGRLDDHLPLLDKLGCTYRHCRYQQGAGLFAT